jgi:hypothetical protein
MELDRPRSTPELGVVCVTCTRNGGDPILPIEHLHLRFNEDDDA